MRPLKELTRPNVWALKPYSSARDEYSGKEASVFLDANENPYNTPNNRYPDPLQRELKGLIAPLKGVKEENIFLGNPPRNKAGLVDWKTMFRRANEVKAMLGKHGEKINVTDKTGDLAALLLVHEEEDILLITDDGTIIRTPAADVRLCGRNTQGVRVMKLAEGSKVIGVARAEKEEETDVSEIVAEMNGEAVEAPAEDIAPETEE